MDITICFLILTSLFTYKISAHPYDIMSNERDSYNRYDPDATVNGFFPFWGVVLCMLSVFFLVVAALGLVGYLMGCRSPPTRRQISTNSTPPFSVIQTISMKV